MSTPANASAEMPDILEIYGRFKELTPGQKAELRRVEEPEELTLKPALYRLFPGIPPRAQYLRIAFFLPWIEHLTGAANLATQFGSSKGKVAEARIFQVARAHAPNDLIQLRRLVIQVKPNVDWTEFGKTLWFWGEPAKRQLVEDYYLAQYSPAKGDKK
jgi:CRISPR system Cascade subunit CasB